MIHFQAKVWIPFVGSDNTDLIDYKGLGFIAVNSQNRSGRIRVSIILNPAKYAINTTLDIRLLKLIKNANQFFIHTVL